MAVFVNRPTKTSCVSQFKFSVPKRRFSAIMCNPFSANDQTMLPPFVRKFGARERRAFECRFLGTVRSKMASAICFYDWVRLVLYLVRESFIHKLVSFSYEIQGRGDRKLFMQGAHFQA